jgi:hypothetical protein
MESISFLVSLPVESLEDVAQLDGVLLNDTASPEELAVALKGIIVSGIEEHLGEPPAAISIRPVKR